MKLWVLKLFHDISCNNPYTDGCGGGNGYESFYGDGWGFGLGLGGYDGDGYVHRTSYSDGLELGVVREEPA
jgi:hypothetical protein